MIALPSIILEQFDQLLRNKALPGKAQFDYTKWLRFYWDFCHKYQHDPFSVDSVWLFLQKLQDKQQSKQQQQQAHQAVSLVYAMQAANHHSSPTEQTNGHASTGYERIKAASSQSLSPTFQHNGAAAINLPNGEQASRRIADPAVTDHTAPVKTGDSWVDTSVSGLYQKQGLQLINAPGWCRFFELFDG